MQLCQFLQDYLVSTKIDYFVSGASCKVGVTLAQYEPNLNLPNTIHSRLLIPNFIQIRTLLSEVKYTDRKASSPCLAFI